MTDHSMQQSEPRYGWRQALTALIVSSLVVLLAGWEAIALASEQWFHNNAYTYCLLIPVISAWLLWERKDELAQDMPRLNLLALALMIGPVGAYIFAWSLDINEGMQLSLVAGLQVVFLTFLGWPLYWKLAFPLNYLWLTVPVGSFLLPTMQSWATYWSTIMLQWASVPVFTDQARYLIEVPTGLYLVAPGCAGLNFLLVAIALSTLFAYLTYRTWFARIMTVVISIIVAITSNWVRVFGIIYIAHVTDSQADIVEDHLLYGWFYFAFIMFFLMMIGLKLADKPNKDTAPAENDDKSP